MKRTFTLIGLVLLFALAKMVSADWRDASLANRLANSYPGERPKIIAENLERITSRFFDSVRAEIRRLCIRGKEEQAYEHWKMLRQTQAAVDIPPEVLVVECNFEVQIPQGVESAIFLEHLPASAAQPWEQLARAEFALSSGEFYQAEKDFQRLRREGIHPEVCQQYLKLIDLELSRYGDF